jgi:hypothetical protein
LDFRTEREEDHRGHRGKTERTQREEKRECGENRMGEALDGLGIVEYITCGSLRWGFFTGKEWRHIVLGVG